MATALHSLPADTEDESDGTTHLRVVLPTGRAVLVGAFALLGLCAALRVSADAREAQQA